MLCVRQGQWTLFCKLIDCKRRGFQIQVFLVICRLFTCKFAYSHLQKMAIFHSKILRYVPTASSEGNMYRKRIGRLNPNGTWELFKHTWHFFGSPLCVFIEYFAPLCNMTWFCFNNWHLVGAGNFGSKKFVNGNFV